MLNNGLAASERSRYGCHTAFGDGEEHVNHALSCNQRHTGRQFLLIRTAFTNRPFLHQSYILIALRSCYDSDDLFYRKFSCLDLFDRSLDTIGDHNPLFYHCGLLYRSYNIAGFHSITYISCRYKIPFQITLQGGNLHTAL